MTEEFFLIDTNILVYAYDNTDKFKNELALELLEDCFGRGAVFFTCLQNICEFLFVITNKIKNKIKPEEAQLVVTDLLEFENFKKLQYKNSMILRASQINKKYKVHYWDALIAATMIENGVFNIYTENVKDFNKIPGIKAVNPFKNSRFESRKY